MAALQAEQAPQLDKSLVNDKIPLENVWLLFLYAFDLAQFRDRFEAEIEESPDFKSLVARLLCYAVEKRLRRNLSFGHRRRHDVLRRVRGRIDILESFSRDLFRRGEVACRFDELTLDISRNRLVLLALKRLSNWLNKDTAANRLSKDTAVLAQQCRTLANALERAGVSSVMPSRTEITADQMALHEGDDRLMVSLAKVVFDHVLPTEQEGTHTMLKTQREDINFPWLYEKAIGNFFKVELNREDGWSTETGKYIYWDKTSSSPGITSYLPIMKTDIILENNREGRRIIIDTKFTNALIPSQHDGERFKTGHIYQLYAYLRSQEHPDKPMSLSSEGILLYPSIGVDQIDETALIQGHRIRFVTINLLLPSAEIVKKLKAIPVFSSIVL